MFVHTVYFWLRDDLTEAERKQFADGVRSLTSISSVRKGHVGVPAGTDRPIIDRSYSCALVVMFDDVAGHDAYQADPIHDRFRDACASLWRKVIIYDSVAEGTEAFSTVRAPKGTEVGKAYALPTSVPKTR